MPNPATTAGQNQNVRIIGLDPLPAGTDRATLTVPVYDPATDKTYHAPADGVVLPALPTGAGPYVLQCANLVLSWVLAGAPPAANQAPSVTISRSASGSGLVGTQETFQAIASDADGTVTKVELLLMADATTTTQFTVLDTDLLSPYVLHWTPTAAGNFNLRTRATDDAGASSLSSNLALQVQAAATGGTTPPPATQPLQTSTFGASKTLVYDGSTVVQYPTMTFQTVQFFLNANAISPVVNQGTFHFFDAEPTGSVNEKRVACNASYQTIHGISPDLVVRRNGVAYTGTFDGNELTDFNDGFVNNQFTCLQVDFPQPVTINPVLLGRLAALTNSLFYMAATVGRTTFYNAPLTDAEANAQQLATGKLVATYTNQINASNQLVDESGNGHHATFLGSMPTVGMSGATIAGAGSLPPADASKKMQVIFFGDSITEGSVSGNPFPDLVGTALGTSKFTTIRKGYPGHDTSELLTLTDSDIIPLYDPACTRNIVCLLASVNDRWNNNLNTLFSVAKSLANLKAITQKLLAAGFIVMVGTPTQLFFDSIRADMELVRQGIRSKAVSEWGALAVIDYARTEPATTPKDAVPVGGIFWADAIHPAGYANYFFAREAWYNIVAYCAAVSFPVNSSYVFPVADAYTKATISSLASQAASFAALSGGSSVSSNNLTLAGNAVAGTTQGFGAAGGSLLGYFEYTVADLVSTFTVGAIAGASGATTAGDLSLAFQQNGGTARAFGSTAGTYAYPFTLAVGDVVRVQFEDSQEPSLGAMSTRVSYYLNGVKVASYHYQRPAGPLRVVVCATGASVLNSVNLYGANLVAA